MKSLNLGIIAHVDAGKTTLTEQLLHQVGVLDQPGSVDAGNTHTDSLELERQRGITIQSSVVSFQINQTKINLIDTPGHADFIAEVERALMVIDAVILVVSAVEGIQAQTRILINTLKRLKKPSLIFVNKIDRAGARAASLVNQIIHEHQLAALPMVRVENMGTTEAQVAHLTTKDSAYYHELMEALIAHDDTFLEKCVAHNLKITKSDFLEQLLSGTSKANFHPIYFGSAATRVGIEELCVGIEHYLPCQHKDSQAAPEGSIFKIEHDKDQSCIAYINLTAGQLKLRETITWYRQTERGEQPLSGKIANMKVFQHGELETTDVVSAGSIACIRGLNDIKIGDTLSQQQNTATPLFARPTLETTITPIHPEKSNALLSQLKNYAAQDPLIKLHQKNNSSDICINLYGEIQKQIIKDRLINEVGIEVKFSDTTMICIERPIQTGEAAHIMDLHNAPLEFYATLGFKIEPGPHNSGIQYNMQAHRGRIPQGYHSVIEEAVFNHLEVGLQGWQVTDCIITLTETGVCPLSIAPHFRQLTPLLLQKALEQAQTQVCEPISWFEIDIPISMLNNVLTELKNHRSIIKSGETNDTTYIIQGEVFTKHLHALQRTLPNITQGRGTLMSQHAGYRHDT